MPQVAAGASLTWEETKEVSEYIKHHGILQFINLYKKNKDTRDDEFKWGDEIEYMIVKFDDEEKTAKTLFDSHNLMPKLNRKELVDLERTANRLWSYEYSSYQIESKPGKPYGAPLAEFNKVETNMLRRRVEAREFLKPDESLLTVTSFPRLGCSNFCYPAAKPTPEEGINASLFLPDEAICQGLDRMRAISISVKLRRNQGLSINIPIYRDKNVAVPFREDLVALGSDGKGQREAKDDHVYMDAAGFGLGCCCLQTTLLGRDIIQARELYDQLTAFCPVMVALTAAAPVFRGYLTDVDSRWIVTRDSGDDRTPGERGVEPLKEDETLMRSGRYGAVEWYLSKEGQRYNDLPLEYDKKWLNSLMDNGVDKILAQHIAHLFARDCISILSTQVYIDDEKRSDCFESIQGTTWRSMRFKPPPADSDIGWRVEFRPMDIQITDFENAAAVCFIILLAKIIVHFNLNTLIPLSKVEENMMRAQKRDAVNKEKLWFRKDIMSHATDQPIDQEYGEFSLNEIINGKQGHFIGIIPLINSYIDSCNVDTETRSTIQQFLNLFGGRASGKLLTDAAWMRKQIINHPDYKEDAVVSERINYDLLKSIDLIARGHQPCPDLFGSHLLPKIP
ncbi:glutamate--cysteine ligase-like isoform X2 [Microplitis mediator]|uniref:glutamate--cysteine ligase-like isoform X2 n=1 Tax=Microplitis mediator TaxID=375433 RepID=UPI002555E957|nr:glutamate--cysteine ligase-like isoform X2 [Microplitis mediator]